MNEMTSRERVAAALRHEEPDRVPLDIGGGNSTSLSLEAYENLKQHLGIVAPTHAISKAFRTAQMDEQTLTLLRGDVRPLVLRPPRNWSPPPSPPGTFIDERGTLWKLVEIPGGFYWEAVGMPLAGAALSDLDKIPWPDPDDPGRYEGLAEEARRLYTATPYALMGDCGIKGFWEPYFVLRGIEQALIDLVADKAFFGAVMDRFYELNTAVARRFLEQVGPYLSVFRTADDLATQQSLLMSPRTYRELLKPYHKRFNAFVRQYTDAKIFFHSCGNVTALLDDLVDAGFDILNPVQVSALGDMAAIKARYGDRLSFWGAIDTQYVLPFGTPDEVRQEVRQRIRQLGVGGGYVAAAVHTVQPDVPPRNILALRDAVFEFGRYPID